MGVRVVVAEDDEKQADILRRYLTRDGHEVVVVHDGVGALSEAPGAALVILDVMMPAPDGLEVCRRLRATSDVAILVLTARAEEDDLVRALDLGADDYVVKPYSPRELAARVRMLLRRAVPTRTPSDVWTVGDLEVDVRRHEVQVRGVPVALTPGEFAVLELLAREPARVFTRDQVISHVHGVDGYLTTRTVDVHVMNVRRKIEADPKQPRRLLTVWGVGYKLVPVGG